MVVVFVNTDGRVCLVNLEHMVSIYQVTYEDGSIAFKVVLSNESGILISQEEFVKLNIAFADQGKVVTTI